MISFYLSTFYFFIIFCIFAPMKQAMVFAAGLGTRLKPLTDTMPKALVRVGGEPLLAHVLLNLKQAGFTLVVINVHHFADQIIAYLSENNNFGLDIRISDESGKLLETGGGIKKAIPLFRQNAPILIHNVDILSNVNLSHFYDQVQDSDATLLVSRRKTKRYLLFEKDTLQLSGWTNVETGEVKGPAAHKAQGGQPFAFSGIHAISPRILPLMDSFPDRFSIIDFYLKACETSSVRGLLKTDLQLLDVGKLDTLREAESFLKANSLRN